MLLIGLAALAKCLPTWAAILEISLRKLTPGERQLVRLARKGIRDV
jgi:hypothetical protein